MKIVAAALAVSFMVSGGFAQAQGRNCGPRPAVIEKLTETYGETRQSIGLGSNNAVVEVFANDETGSWTITVTMADGMTCLLAAGNAFENTNGDLKPTAGEPL